MILLRRQYTVGSCTSSSQLLPASLAFIMLHFNAVLSPSCSLHTHIGAAVQSASLDCRSGSVCSGDSAQLAAVLPAAGATCQPGIHHAALQCSLVARLPHDGLLDIARPERHSCGCFQVRMLHFNAVLSPGCLMMVFSQGLNDR